MKDVCCPFNTAACRTAIHLAARAGHVPMLRLLMESRPVDEQEQLANAPDFFGLTPVFLALQRWACALGVCSLRCGVRRSRSSWLGLLRSRTRVPGAAEICRLVKVRRAQECVWILTGVAGCQSRHVALLVS